MENKNKMRDNLNEKSLLSKFILKKFCNLFQEICNLVQEIVIYFKNCVKNCVMKFEISNWIFFDQLKLVTLILLIVDRKSNQYIHMQTYTHTHTSTQIAMKTELKYRTRAWKRIRKPSWFFFLLSSFF